MTRYLLFDSGCVACSSLAQAIEQESHGWLTARSLREPDAQALLDQACPGWKWEPTLLEQDGEHLRAFTGLALRRRMLFGLGPKKTWRVAQLILQAESPSSDEVKHGRRHLLKLGGAFVGALALGLWGMPDLAAYAATTKAGHGQTEKTLLSSDHPAIARLKASRVVRRAARHFGSPQWHQVYQLKHQETGKVGYLIFHQPADQAAAHEGRFLLVTHLGNARHAHGIVGRIIPTGKNSHVIHWHLPNALHLGTTTKSGQSSSTELNSHAVHAHPRHRHPISVAKADQVGGCFAGCLIVLGSTVGPLCELDCAACAVAPELLITCAACAICVGGQLFECWNYCENGGIVFVNYITYSYTYSYSGPGPKRI